MEEIKADLSNDEALIDLIAQGVADFYGSNSIPIDKVKEALRYEIKRYLQDKQNLSEENVAQKWYKTIDHLIYEEKKYEEQEKDGGNYRKVVCKKKCSFCCNIAVVITNEEAKLLSKISKEKNIKINKKRLKLQMIKNAENWHDLGIKNMRCVFLRENECSIYEYRPIVCRTHFVMDGKMLCYPYEKNHRVRHWKPIIVSVAEAAAMLCGEADLMARKLLKLI